MKTIFIAFTLKNSSMAQFFVELANQLSHSNQVILFTHSVEKHPFQIHPDITILEWPSKRPTRIADFRCLLAMVNKYKPDSMISNFAAVNIFSLVGFVKAVPHRIAWCHTLTTQLEEKRLLRLRKIFIYRLATRIVANSKATKNDLIKNFKVRKSKITVYPYALKDKGIKCPLNYNKIVYAGRLDEVKGVETLIKAIPLVIERFPEVKFTIVGDDKTGHRGQDLKLLVRELGVKNNVIFLGNKSRDEVLREFSEAYFSVVPSYSEAFGFVVIESFSVGTPVIGANTSGIAEIIRDQKDGVLFRVKDFRDLAEKMIMLLSDHNLRRQMSINSKKHFLEEFELSSSAEKLIEVLELK